MYCCLNDRSGREDATLYEPRKLMTTPLWSLKILFRDYSIKNYDDAHPFITAALGIVDRVLLSCTVITPSTYLTQYNRRAP